MSKITKKEAVKQIVSLNLDSIIQSKILEIISDIYKTQKTVKAVNVETVYIETLLRNNSETEIDLKSLTNKLNFAKDKLEIENVDSTIKKINNGEIITLKYKSFRIKK